MDAGKRGAWVRNRPSGARAHFRVSVESLLEVAPMPSLAKARVSPAALRHIQQLRELSECDRRIVKRITDALRRS